MANFDQFISTFHTEDNKGGQFEKFCKWFLENDPVWKNKVDKVWLFKDFPDRWSNKDLGVDLVFRDVDKKIWAVQAKCYSQDYYMTYDDMSRFLAESNRSIIDKRLLLASTNNLGHNAISVLDGQDRKPVIRYLLKDFQNSKLDYPTTFKALKKGKLLPKPKPIGKYKYQLDPINAVVKSFKQYDRGQLIMACGTGKTFTTLWIKEKLKAENTLILLPSLSLLSQTLTEWNFGMNQNFRSLAICSDFTVSKGAKDDDRTSDKISELPFPVTTDIKEIQLFLKSKGRKVVFSTYQSSKVIADAMRSRSVPFFDLVIADEAHRCAGNVEGSFSTILDDKKIRTKRKLFTTATPKTYSANLRQKAIDRELVITGMDDEKVFGPVFYQLSFADAIKKKLLTDYQLVILGVNDKTVSNFIDRRELLSSKLESYTDAKSLATFIGLLKAIRKYDLKRIISFHNRVSTAQKFSEEILDILELLPKKDLPKGKLATDYVKGTMPTSLRRQKLEQLKALSRGDVMLLTNARCLSEGVDVPALDAVAIIDPRQSKVDIVQTVGRAIRLSNNKKIGTIIIPVFLEKGKQAETVISKSNLKPVWDIVNALKSHDEELSIELDSFRTELGKQKKTSRHVTGLSKIVVDLPAEYDAKFSRAISTELVETTTESWNFWFGLLERHIESNGFMSFPRAYKTSDGYALINWVGGQRQKYKKGQLSPEKVARLNQLGFLWDPIEVLWYEGYKALKEYVEINHSTLVPSDYKTSEGLALGNWTSKQRQDKKNNQLRPEYESKLNQLSFVWSVNDESWQHFYNLLTEYKADCKNTNVHQKYMTDNGERLGEWVLGQRKDYKKGKLTEEKIKLLNRISFLWDAYDAKWNESYKCLVDYYKEHGHSQVHTLYKNKDGHRLGAWVSYQRKGYKLIGKRNWLNDEKVQLLNKVNFVWAAAPQRTPIKTIIKYLEAYKKEYKDLDVSLDYKTSDGFELGKEVGNTRTHRRKKRLTAEEISQLDKIDFIWDAISFRWERGFSYLVDYAKNNDLKNLPTKFITKSGFKLGAWLSKQKRAENNNKLPPLYKKRLEEVGIVWDILEYKWNIGYQALLLYAKKNNGSVNVHQDYRTDDKFNLGTWVSTQRNRYREKVIKKEHIDKLNEVGFIWNHKIRNY